MQNDDFKSRYQEQSASGAISVNNKGGLKSKHNWRKSRSKLFLFILFVAFFMITIPVIFYTGLIIPDRLSDTCDAIEPSEKGEFSDEALQAIRQCPAQRIVELALAKQTESPGKALALLEFAAQQNDGPAARLIGEMYDPHYWAENKSPFKQPDARNAIKWYNRAIALNDNTARERLQKLELESNP